MEYYSSQGYSDEIKQQCLKMYVNGMGFRAIEREIAGEASPADTPPQCKEFSIPQC